MANDEINQKLNFLKLDRETGNILRNLRHGMQTKLDGVLDKFYAHVGAQPGLGAMLGSESNQRRVKDAQKHHWLTLLEAQFDDTYYAKVRTIGEAHFKHNLPPTTYMGGYCFALNEIISLILEENSDPKAANEKISAMIKAVFLDMDLALAVYHDAIEKDRERRQQLLQQLITQFDDNTKGPVENSSKASSDLASIANELRLVADRTTQLATITASASEEASTNVQTVSSASEEMTASIGEITTQVTRSLEIASKASSEANATSRTMETLAVAANSIGKIVNLIKSVADQTNLLALNATIEAARAGEAGRGFAVVAQEVKSLAQQTAKATEEITGHVQNVQNITKEAVDAIGSINSTISTMNEISTSISAAMEEQHAATREISRSTQEASLGTQEVTRNITDVTKDASLTLESATEVASVAEQLTAATQSLSTSISDFFERVKSV